MDTSNASAGESSGSIPGKHEANSDLPAPGGPTIAKLWPPAAAISSARFAVSCPLTIFKSGPVWRGSAIPGSGGRSKDCPFKWFSKPSKSGAATTSISPAQGAWQLPLRTSAGAVISSVRRNSIVYDTNLQPGFVVTSVNGNRIKNASEAIEIIRSAVNQISLDGYYMGEPDLYSYRFRKE
jgi:hypothetical protein